MDYSDFTDIAQKSLKKASQISKEKKHKEIKNGHLLKGILEMDTSVSPFLLNEFGIKANNLLFQLNRLIETYPKIEDKKERKVSKEVENSLNVALKVSKKLKDEYISIEHIVSGILLSGDEVAKILKEKGIKDETLQEAIKKLRKQNVVNEETGEVLTLEKYASNLTRKANEGKIDPIIGRSDEIRRLLQIISRRRKNNPMVVGEPGVGKTAIIEGLALRIIADDVPEDLQGTQIYSLEIGSLMAGASAQGEFEKRLKNIISEVQESAGDIILFIDEIHMLVGTGRSGADAANLLKPALARGDIRIIGATTTAEYKKYIEKDKALERRFQLVRIEEPTEEECLSILRGIKEKYENYHKIRILDEALHASVQFSIRYVTDRSLPDKAIDLLDESAGKIRLELTTLPDEIDEVERKIQQYKLEREILKKEENQSEIDILTQKIREASDKRTEMRAKWESEKKAIQEIVTKREEIKELKKQANELEQKGSLEELAKYKYENIPTAEKELEDLQVQFDQSNSDFQLFKDTVDKDAVAEVVSEWTGIPLNKMMQSEQEKLLHLEEELGKRVIGQVDAIRAVSQAVRRSRTGLSDAKRPIGSFIFLGTTGVGKTELAKALAEFLFDSEESMIRLDMSEYMEKHAVARLYGPPPGYVGFEEGGQLTEAVKRRPYSVILFDEIEKAHPDTFNVLLQVLDDGRLTDSSATTVNFKNTIIIMTSNAGADKIYENFKQMTKANAVQLIAKTKNDVTTELKKKMRPEFLNRIDEIILFLPLSYPQIKKISVLQLNSLKKKLTKNEITFDYDHKGLTWLAKKSYNPQFGARPIKRSIQRYVLNHLSELILKGEVKKELIILMSAKDSKLSFTNVTPEKLLEFKKQVPDEKKEEQLREKNEKQENIEKIKPSFWKRFANWWKNLF